MKRQCLVVYLECHQSEPGKLGVAHNVSVLLAVKRDSSTSNTESNTSKAMKRHWKVLTNKNWHLKSMKSRKRCYIHMTQLMSFLSMMQ